ncbi:acireductone dioxygenase [Acidocella sp.]|uniref:1,2-dihydroxy-3-keto-5-methylthiopentene dioxygenase n=1 Tax=Acidocella sp. TaxID=50710 RepID=UPI00260736F7|nr:cupin domain-containing protein [Acidocella sp.]
MTRLTVYDDREPERILFTSSDPAAIAPKLREINVGFERWDAPIHISPDAESETILDAFRPYLNTLMGATGAGSADVVKLTPDHPMAGALREKFLQEHTHSEDEIRFFVAGSGHFVIHEGGKVYVALCEAGDLIRVPAGARHWFDAGRAPEFTALRVFTHTEGWVAQFTGDTISDRFPLA